MKSTMRALFVFVSLGAQVSMLAAMAGHSHLQRDRVTVTRLEPHRDLGPHRDPGSGGVTVTRSRFSDTVPKGSYFALYIAEGSGWRYAMPGSGGDLEKKYTVEELIRKMAEYSIPILRSIKQGTWYGYIGNTPSGNSVIFEQDLFRVPKGFQAYEVQLNQQQ